MAWHRSQDADYGKNRLWASVAWGLLATAAGALVSSRGIGAGFVAYGLLSLPCVLIGWRLRGPAAENFEEVAVLHTRLLSPEDAAAAAAVAADYNEVVAGAAGEARLVVAGGLGEQGGAKKAPAAWGGAATGEAGATPAVFIPAYRGEHDMGWDGTGGSCSRESYGVSSTMQQWSMTGGQGEHMQPQQHWEPSSQQPPQQEQDQGDSGVLCSVIILHESASMLDAVGSTLDAAGSTLDAADARTPLLAATGSTPSRSPRPPPSPRPILSRASYASATSTAVAPTLARTSVASQRGSTSASTGAGAGTQEREALSDLLADPQWLLFFWKALIAGFGTGVCGWRAG